MNSEGYRDPTAERAIRAAGHLPEDVWEAVKIVRSFLGLVHLDLVEITVIDRNTAKKYKWGGGTIGSEHPGGIRGHERRNKGPKETDRARP